MSVLINNKIYLESSCIVKPTKNTFNRMNKNPLESKVVWETYADALAYINDQDETAYVGQLLMVVNDTESKKGVYQVISSDINNTNGDGYPIPTGLKKVGGGALTFTNYSEVIPSDGTASTIATADSVGQLINITTDQTIGEGDDAKKYPAGLYIVTGANTIERLGTSDPTTDLESRVESLETTVNGSDTVTGLVTKVGTARVDETTGPTGLYKIIEDNEKVTAAALNDLKDTKQDNLTAGAGISIVNNVVTCTLDTTIFKIVDTLPTENINTNIIYLKLNSDNGETGNIYTEYCYMNNAWEVVGNYENKKLDWYEDTTA